MVQSSDSDREYIPTGADGTDDEDDDYEQDDDEYDYAYGQDADDANNSDNNELGSLGDIVLSPCALPFLQVTSTEDGTVCFTQALRLWLHCRS